MVDGSLKIVFSIELGKFVFEQNTNELVDSKHCLASECSCDLIRQDSDSRPCVSCANGDGVADYGQSHIDNSIASPLSLLKKDDNPE